MTFKEIVLLEDKLISKLGTAELFRRLVERLEWDMIEEIYNEIDEEIKNEEKGVKKKCKLNLNLLKR